VSAYPQVEVPERWFGEFDMKIGQEFDLVWKARVVQIEEPQIDVTQFGDMDQETMGGEVMVTLLLRDMRMPMAELDKLIAT
jgi:hypothetical protein